MKTGVFALLLVFCYVECKKTYAPIDKNANVAFINMEGGGIKPAPRPAMPVAPAPAKTPSQPTPPAKPAVPAVPAVPAKPAQPTPAAKPTAPATQPTTPKPVPVVTPQPKTPNQIKPVPVNPAPVANPVTTPGPGSVKDLVNFYNSQGKASPIRPYSYSQAVKQG